MITGYPLEKIFKTALKNGGSFADLYQESSEISSVVCDDNKIEKVITGTDTGIGLRAIANLKTSYAYSNCCNETGILDLADALANGVNPDSEATIARTYSLQQPVDFHIRILPNTVDTGRKVAIVREANAAARAVDPRVRQVKVLYSDKHQRLAIANSEGLLVEEERTYTLFFVHVVAADKNIIQTGYEPVGGLIGFELFDQVDVVNVARTAARRRKAPSGMMPVILSSEAGGTMIHEAVGHGLEADLALEMPVILSSEAGGTMIHEAVGHGLEADLALEGLSVYTNRIGETVASPLITVVDDATLAGKRGSYGYDDEGVPAQRTLLVEKGILKGYLCDRLYAMRFDMISTGNGRRQSYKHHPIVRMSNTFIAPAEESPDTILRNTPEGILVKKMGGGQVNTVNGDFVFEVSEVADAQPTLRIPEIVVGGTSQK